MGRYWKKARKDVEDVLVKFDEAGWRIKDPPTYYQVLCPCGMHKRWIHLTPSDPKYLRNAIQWLKRQPCYQEGGRP
jgi:hypothetical protein